MPVPPRLSELFRDPGSVDLAESLLHLAAARPGATVDVAGRLAEIDAWAAALETPTVDALRVLVYDRLGFVGDVDDYHDPANSFLDQVMDRRQGMPITLAAIVLAVARRRDVALEPIGMPGHFVVQDGMTGDYLDPFDRLRPQSAAGLRERLAHLGIEPSAAALAPVDDASIVLRVLNNLTNSYVQRDPRGLDWLLDLRLDLPRSTHELSSLAPLCEQRGRWHDAAELLDQLASTTEGEHLRRRAHALRARLN